MWRKIVVAEVPHIFEAHWNKNLKPLLKQQTWQIVKKSTPLFMFFTRNPWKKSSTQPGSQLFNQIMEGARDNSPRRIVSYHMNICDKHKFNHIRNLLKHAFQHQCVERWWKIFSNLVRNKQSIGVTTSSRSCLSSYHTWRRLWRWCSFPRVGSCSLVEH